MIFDVDVYRWHFQQFMEAACFIPFGRHCLIPQEEYPETVEDSTSWGMDLISKSSLLL